MGLAFGFVRPWGMTAFRVRPVRFFTSSKEDQATSARASADGVVTRGPNVQRVEQAFAALAPNRTEAIAIRALIERPGATDAELSSICGWTPSVWRMQMLVACYRRHRELWPEGLPADVPPGFALTALVTYEPTRQRFWLREDVMPALVSRV